MAYAVAIKGSLTVVVGRLRQDIDNDWYVRAYDTKTGTFRWEDRLDVGQNDIEELNRVFKGGNYGWPIKEGSFYFDPNGEDEGFITSVPVTTVPPNLVDPIAEYDHDEGLSIIGGFVYRGTELPALAGRYITGDFGTATPDPSYKTF